MSHDGLSWRQLFHVIGVHLATPLQSLKVCLHLNMERHKPWGLGALSHGAAIRTQVTYLIADITIL